MKNVKDMNVNSRPRVYNNQLVTVDDLELFKEDLLLSIKAIILGNSPQPAKKWLKSYEVKILLNISPGTLQTLRSNGTIPYTRIGGIIYYDQDDINKVLAARKRGDLNKTNIR
jgi:hypothetical protein